MARKQNHEDDEPTTPVETEVTKETKAEKEAREEAEAVDAGQPMAGTYQPGAQTPLPVPPVGTPIGESDPSMQRAQTMTIVGPDGKQQEVSTKPTDLEDYKGSFKHPTIKEPFGLKIEPNNPYGRTHWAKNTNYTWGGTEAEFKQLFEKEK